MMRKIVFIVLLACGIKSSAQEVDMPSYINHMMENPFLISPSYAGIGAGFQIRLNGISQWAGVKDAPNTQSLSVENRFNGRLGGGVTLFNDKNGFTRQMGAKVSAAYHLTLSDFYNSFFSFSFGANYTQFSIDTGLFKAQFQEELPSISNGTINFDVSALYRFEKFAISLNIFNLLDKNVKSFDSGEPLTLRKYSLYPVYTYAINPNLEIEPSLFFEYFESDGRFHTDLNVKLRKRISNGYMWVGSSLTFANSIDGFTPNTLAPIVGLKKRSFYIAYGVGFSLNETSGFNFGTHMITIGIDNSKSRNVARCTESSGML